jgi:hypothetical protein
MEDIIVQLNEWKIHPRHQALKQQAYVLLGLIVLLGLYGFVLGFWWLSFIALGIALVILWLWYDVNQDRLKTKIVKQRKVAMMESMAYVKIFLYSGLNVYQALKQAQNHTSVWMRSRLETMLIKMDEDKSFRPFYDLARPLNTLALEQLMIALYQITQTGMTGVYLSHFFYVFDQLEGSISRLSFSQFEEELEGQHTWAMGGTAIVTLMILYSIITLIQEMIYGL